MIPGEQKDAVADIFPSILKKSEFERVPENSVKSNVYRWERWESPNFHTYLKDSYYVLKDDFLNIKTYIIE